MNPQSFSFHRIALGDVGSTNDEARQRLEMLGDGPYVVTGARQLSGRGRRGRAWVSPEGNVYASFALRPDAPLSRFPELSFVAALAVSDAAIEVVPDGTRVRCKWPNDVLVDGAKVSGILLETAATPQGQAVIVGIGVNVISKPADTPYPATALAEYDAAIRADTVFEALSRALARRISQWEAGGFPAVRADWMARADALNEQVIARLSDREVRGRFVDLDEDGALLLETGAGDMVRIAAGDIFRPTKED